MIIFLRIPKTGSQTLTRIARQNYAPRRSRGLPNMFTKAERCREELERVARRGQVIDFASGHLAFDRDTPLPPGARYFTMLREPVKRAISHYHAYTRRAVRNGRLPSDVPLERITPHEFRHSYAAMMIAAGVNPKALQAFMGHASITVTLDTYGHLMPGSEAEAAVLVESYLTAQQERAEDAARAAGGELTGAQAGARIPAEG